MSRTSAPSIRSYGEQKYWDDRYIRFLSKSEQQDGAKEMSSSSKSRRKVEKKEQPASPSTAPHSTSSTAPRSKAARGGVQSATQKRQRKQQRARDEHEGAPKDGEDEEDKEADAEEDDENDVTADWYYYWSDVRALLPARFLRRIAAWDVVDLGCGISPLILEIEKEGNANANANATARAAGGGGPGGEGGRLLLAVDYSPTVVRHLRATHPRSAGCAVEFREADICSAGFFASLAPESVDLFIDKATSDGLLCAEASAARTPAMYAAVARALRVGGYFVLISVNDTDHAWFAEYVLATLVRHQRVAKANALRALRRSLAGPAPAAAASSSSHSSSSSSSSASSSSSSSPSSSSAPASASSSASELDSCSEAALEAGVAWGAEPPLSELPPLTPRDACASYRWAVTVHHASRYYDGDAQGPKVFVLHKQPRPLPSNLRTLRSHAKAQAQARDQTEERKEEQRRQERRPRGRRADRSAASALASAPSSSSSSSRRTSAARGAKGSEENGRGGSGRKRGRARGLAGGEAGQGAGEAEEEEEEEEAEEEEDEEEDDESYVIVEKFH